MRSDSSFGRRSALLCAVLAFIGAVPELRAQESPAGGETPFAFVLSAGGGWSRYVTPTPLSNAVKRGGPNAGLRLMWHPDHRLRIGVESGWTSFYSYTLTDVETSFGRTDAALQVSAIPMLVVFSMPVWHGLELFGGAGVYLVNSRAESFGTVVDVDELSQGWMLAAAYNVQLSRRFSVSAETVWYGATQFEDAVIALQARFSWRVVEW